MHDQNLSLASSGESDAESVWIVQEITGGLTDKVDEHKVCFVALGGVDGADLDAVLLAEC